MTPVLRSPSSPALILRSTISADDLRDPHKSFVTEKSKGLEKAVHDAPDTLMTCYPPYDMKEDRIVIPTPPPAALKTDSSRRFKSGSSTVSYFDLQLKEVPVQSPQLVLNGRRQSLGQPIEQSRRPNAQHVPGSYKSENIEGFPLDLRTKISNTDESDKLPNTADQTLTSPDQAPFPSTKSPVSPMSETLVEDAQAILFPAHFKVGGHATQGHAHPWDPTHPKSLIPSLLSTASKGSTRHALLKPSFIPDQPLNPGLPVQPLLTDLPAEELKDSLEHHSEKTGDLISVPYQHHIDTSRTPATMLVDILNKESHLKDASRIGHVNAHIPKEIPAKKSSNHATNADATEPIEGSEVGSGTATNSANVSGHALQSLTATHVDPFSHQASDYADLEVIDREKVESALQMAMQNVLHNTVIPPGRKRREVSVAYRQLVAESLVEAARNVDKYLRQSSVWSSAPVKSDGGEEDLLKEDENVKNSSSITTVTKSRLASLEATSKSDAISTYLNDEAGLIANGNQHDTNGHLSTYSSSHYSSEVKGSAPSVPASHTIITQKETSQNKSKGEPKVAGSASDVSEEVRLVPRLQNSEVEYCGQSRFSHWNPPSSWRAFHFKKAHHGENHGVSRMSSLEKLKAIRRKPKANESSHSHLSRTVPPIQILSEQHSGSDSIRNELSTSSKELKGNIAPANKSGIFMRSSQSSSTRKPVRLSGIEEAKTIIPDCFNRERTTDWLRDILSSRDESSRRLKSVPEQLDYTIKRPIIFRSRTDPSTVFDDIRFNANPEGMSSFSDVQVSRNFAGAISNLEHLLSEALEIACQAASIEEVPEVSRAADQISMLPGKLQSQVQHPTNAMVESLYRSKSSISSEVSSPDMRLFAKEGPIVFNSSGNRLQTYREPADEATGATAIVEEDLPIISQSRKSSTRAVRSGNIKGTASQSRINSLVSWETDIGNFRLSRRPSQPRETDTRFLHDLAISKPKLEIPNEEDDQLNIRTTLNPVSNKREVREYIRVFHQPPIQPRGSSLTLRSTANAQLKEFSRSSAAHGHIREAVHLVPGMGRTSLSSLDGTPENRSESGGGINTHASGEGMAAELQDVELHNLRESREPERDVSGRRMRKTGPPLLDLRGKSHVSLEGNQGFSLSRSHRRQPIARDWSPFRKRFVAAVACINTALIGILVGIYAGEVPSIQYYIADLGHVAILGNVFFYIGLAIPTLLFWPLPLLHGRKPYILGALTVAMPLLIPQANSVATQRSPYTAVYRVGVILPRAFMGFCLGFANMNFLATLTDLFGASLMSGNPHQEVVDEYDVRRHGGGLGIWLGIWTWCSIGSIGIGFLIGAGIINKLTPDWGIYVSVVIIAAVLLLNVITPEVRRSAYRRSVAEVRTHTNVSRRVAKGEVMMHRIQTGPTWWGEEFYHGLMLSLGMIRQPGFLVMALYMAWIYGQIVLTIVLLGALMSRAYHFQSPAVGATCCAIPIGALLAVPFQKASLLSRARHHPQRTDSMTFQKRVTWSSHLVRRSIFTLVLPFADVAYTVSSQGPPTPWIIPVLFAGLIGFLSNLAIAECNGIIMEAFDTSDLQPGMTGRPRGASGERTRHKRTNYSSFPRVSSAFAISQSLGFIFAAGATGIGGVAQRRLGQQAATGVMAAILLLLTLLLLAALFRWKEIQIIPTTKTGDMERWEKARKASVERQRQLEKVGLSAQNAAEQAKQEEEPWRPVIIGNPSGKFRRVSVLELGSLTRWSEIRRRNRLIDEIGLESRHPNLATLGSVRGALRENLSGSSRGGAERDSKEIDSDTSGIEMKRRDKGK